LKKALLILVAVVFAPMLVLTLRVRAAGEWRTIGKTASGDTVSISSVHVKKDQRLALVRVEYRDPPQLPHGGPFVEMRARVRFNCSTGTATATSEWFYTRDRSGRFVVSKKESHDSEFGKGAEGDFADLVSKSVCSQ